ncbi:MAG: ethanolamine permease [Myxococcales bacterium]|nr:ethanolamine permease [Myxococcales bacterium]MCB9629583.1 ethanolamine permease [Sandaracinaceae bacterium]
MSDASGGVTPPGTAQRGEGARPPSGGAQEGVTYESVAEGYFEARQLKRWAGPWSLWALGVGAVISGDFFGWQFGLTHGGFGGLLLATGIVSVMYAGLCFSIAEMSAALPHAGGAYSFARSAMGPWGGYVTGLAENMEYVLTPAVIVVGVGGYLQAILGTPDAYQPLLWLGCYVVFVGLNVAGASVSFRTTLVVTLMALGILVVFWVGALPHVSTAHAFDIPPNTAVGGTRFLPEGWLGVLRALPFAIWFFLAIEELPLAAEEAVNPVRDMPRALGFGLLTLVLAAFLTLGLNSAIPPGAAALAESEEPLLVGLRTIFGAGASSSALALVAVVGLMASFHGIVFAYGRQIYSLSRAGYFPRFLSLTHPTRQTPHVALVVGAGLGFAVACLIRALGTGSPVGAVLLNMAVFGAVLSYVLQMLSYVLLRKRHPQLARPYKSPLGMPGAVVALLVSLVTLVALFVSDPVYRKVVLGAAVWYGAGLLYFAFFARHRLVLAPEELAARERG